MSSTSNHRARPRGQSLVEFALVLPLLLLLFSGGADLARAYFVGIQVADGARQAAVYASGNAPTLDPSGSGYLAGTGYTAAQLQTIAENNAGAGPLNCPTSGLTVTSSPSSPTPGGAPYYETVTVSCRLPLLTPLLPSPVTIGSTAQVLVVPEQ
ncbi:MAG TPA: TadE/TadG family type IV pilus assembly protein [Candidatus Dormibacteraeota bacterium]|nr:TadE/TadG family type IV pilus assembly protein [Candidatus Dormibacteraeota bacterium]